jgi:hypothetical protein
VVREVRPDTTAGPVLRAIGCVANRSSSAGELRDALVAVAMVRMTPA